MENYKEKFISTDSLFLINRSEIEGRIDPHPYHRERKEAIAKLERNNKLLKLREIVTNKKSTTSIINDETTYVGLENIKSNTGEYIESSEKASISSARVFKKGQILFPKLRPYLNKVYLADFDGICSTEFHVFKTQPSFLPDFLAIYLRSSLVLNQTKHLMTGNTLPRLQTEDVYSLPVPQLSIERQKEIISAYQKQFQNKQSNEKKVNSLLNGIDAYLIGELGISSNKLDPSYVTKYFTINFSKVLGNRLDPELILYNQTISESNYPSVGLGKLLKKSPQYGANEAGIDREDVSTPRYIRITDIDSYGFLHDELGKTATTIEEKYFLQDKDILFARSGNTVGKSYIHNKNEVDYDCFFAGYMIRFVVDETKLLPDYLFGYTQSGTYKNWVKAIQRTAGQPNINAEEYKSLKIPLPPLEKQREIAEHIKSIRSEAIRIQKEADQILEDTKLEVERMILGE